MEPCTSFTLHDLSLEPVCTDMFYHDQSDTKMTVYDYYRDYKNFKLRYRYQPCIAQKPKKRKDGTSFSPRFPMVSNVSIIKYVFVQQ